MIQRWDNYFLEMALVTARMSKDPSTKVGAVLVKADRIVATGFNGFPRGIRDFPDRYADREQKLELVVHAEMNAILNAARAGVSTLGTTLYIIATDGKDARWGGPPCCRCAVEVIQAGIAEIVSLPFKDGLSKWKDSIERAQKILKEAQVLYREVE